MSAQRKSATVAYAARSLALRLPSTSPLSAKDAKQVAKALLQQTLGEDVGEDDLSLVAKLSLTDEDDLTVVEYDQTKGGPSPMTKHLSDVGRMQDLQDTTLDRLEAVEGIVQDLRQDAARQQRQIETLLRQSRRRRGGGVTRLLRQVRARNAAAPAAPCAHQ